MSGLGHYAILTRSVKKLMVMTTRLMDLGYTYERHRMKRTPDIIVTINNLV